MHAHTQCTIAIATLFPLTEYVQTYLSCDAGLNLSAHVRVEQTTHVHAFIVEGRCQQFPRHGLTVLGPGGGGPRIGAVQLRVLHTMYHVLYWGSVYQSHVWGGGLGGGTVSEYQDREITN